MKTFNIKFSSLTKELMESFNSVGRVYNFITPDTIKDEDLLEITIGDSFVRIGQVECLSESNAIELTNNFNKVLEMCLVGALDNNKLNIFSVVSSNEVIRCDDVGEPFVSYDRTGNLCVNGPFVSFDYNSNSHHFHFANLYNFAVGTMFRIGSNYEIGIVKNAFGNSHGKFDLSLAKYVKVLK